MDTVRHHGKADQNLEGQVLEVRCLAEDQAWQRWLVRCAWNGAAAHRTECVEAPGHLHRLLEQGLRFCCTGNRGNGWWNFSSGCDSLGGADESAELSPGRQPAQAPTGHPGGAGGGEAQASAAELRGMSLHEFMNSKVCCSGFLWSFKQVSCCCHRSGALLIVEPRDKKAQHDPDVVEPCTTTPKSSASAICLRRWEIFCRHAGAPTQTRSARRKWLLCVRVAPPNPVLLGRAAPPSRPRPKAARKVPRSTSSLCRRSREPGPEEQGGLFRLVFEGQVRDHRPLSGGADWRCLGLLRRVRWATAGPRQWTLSRRSCTSSSSTSWTRAKERAARTASLRFASGACPTTWTWRPSRRSAIRFGVKARRHQEAFAECGGLANCRCLKTEDGQLKGIAFVEFKDEEAVKKALEFNGTEYSGRTIYVSKACDREGKGKGGKGKDKGKGKGRADSFARRSRKGKATEHSSQGWTFGALVVGMPWAVESTGRFGGSSNEGAHLLKPAGSAGTKQTFDDSDDEEEERPAKKAKVAREPLVEEDECDRLCLGFQGGAPGFCMGTRPGMLRVHSFANFRFRSFRVLREPKVLAPPTA
eukprot:s2201_g12.t3